MVSLEELKRRRIVRAALVYGAVGWAIVQAADVFVPALRLPDALVTAVALAVILGFPLAMVLAWLFDLTPEGLVRAPPAPAPATRPHTARWLGARTGAVVVVALLTGAVLGWIARQAAPGGGSDAAPSAMAVLPFRAADGDQESRLFADGMTEEIIIHLSRVDALRVIAPASVMPYRDAARPLPEIADDLGVRYLVEGSVRRAGDRVRIGAQLADARTGTTLWADSYDRRLQDIFAIQGEIAREVAHALEARLAPGVAEQIERRPTTDLAAYDLYLRGRGFWHQRTREGLEESARLFRKAVEQDPDFARAWAGLADASSVMAFYDYRAPSVAYPDAEAAAHRALSIDPSLAEAHASLGYILLYYRWRPDDAEREFRRAIQLSPSNSVAHQWYANLLVATGRFQEAEQEMQRARSLNPLSRIADGALAWVYYYAGRYEDAVGQCEAVLRLNPDWDLCHLWKGQALDQLGRSDQALQSLRRAIELSGRSGITVAAHARALAAAGRAEEARSELQRLVADSTPDRHLPSFDIARVYLALGEPQEALAWLQRAFAERSHSMVFLAVEPQLAALRDDPIFRELVRRVQRSG